MPVPNTFANATATIPLSQLDANFATTITLGNTAIQLGNTVSTLNNMTLANVTVSSGNVTITNVTVTTANVTTANIATAQIANVTVSGTGTFAAGSNTAPSITTSGDTNTGIYFPAADTIAFTEGGVESMRINSVGNVGIGATSVLSTVGRVVQILNSGSSVATLQLQDSTTGSTASDGLQLQVNGATSYLWSYENGPLIFGTNNAERMRIDSSGNLGLGVTPSAGSGKQLEVGFVGNSIIGRAAAVMDIAANVYYNAGYKYATNAAASMYQQGSGAHLWYNATSGTAGNAITFTQAMTLDASGNLALNQTPLAWASGSKAVQVNSYTALFEATGGDSNISSNAYLSAVGTYRSIGTAGLSRYQLDFGLHKWFVAPSTTAGNIATFSQVMQLDNNGALSVTPRAITSAITGQGSGAGDLAQQMLQLIKFDNNSTTSQVFAKFFINNGGNACGQINANGANTAAFGSTSDRRVKDNIEDLPSQLQNILALRPVEFDYIESYGGGHQIGFIAQDMEQIYPDAVSEDATEDKIKSITGWSKTEARLVKAIQELNAKVEALEAQLKGNA